MDIQNTKIAIIHDWFIRNSFGGAEKVTLLLDKFISKKYSTPQIFSITSNLDLKDDFIKGREVKTSFIQKLPFGNTKVQNYLPLLPFAIEQVDLRNFDLIISSSHAFAKGVLTNPDQLHISYIHTPMRYAWDQMNVYLEQSKLSKSGFEIPLRYILYRLRKWDFISSNRIDYLISNSNFTARRIKKFWGLDSEVIHPPVNIERFECDKTRERFYLSVNRLVPNKRIDLLILAFNKLGLPLIIIGDGPERIKLQKIANSNIKFLRNISNIEVADYMQRCRAFVYAGKEDFGIAPVEAMASGAPVIAYGGGGILDTVNCLTSCKKGKTPSGILFKKQSHEDIVDTINWFEDKKIWRKFDPNVLNNYAQNFNRLNFTTKIDYFIKNAWNNFDKNL